MATISDFIPKVQPYVQGCPESLMLDHIRDAIIRFCEESTIWRDTFAPADVKKDIDDYTVTPSDLGAVTSIISIMFDDVQIYHKTEEELDYLDRLWRTGLPGTPSYYTLLAPNRFKLTRVPEKDITGGLDVRVSLKPLPTATIIPDILFNDWQHFIAQGAIATLKEMPEHTWSDVNGAVVAGRKFVHGYATAKVRAQKGFGRKPIVAKMRKW